MCFFFRVRGRFDSEDTERIQNDENVVQGKRECGSDDLGLSALLLAVGGEAPMLTEAIKSTNLAPKTSR